MRFVSFNVNGIRARLHQLGALEASQQPDVVALQEIKVADEQFPLEALQALGYPHVAFYGEKGHYGVALAAKVALTDVQAGVPWREEDQQRRFISAQVTCAGQSVRLINGYFPQGESRKHPTKFPGKAQFFEDVYRYLEELCDPDEHLIVAGDMNVAAQDADIGIGPDNAKRWLRIGKAGFLPEEREWLEKLMSWGLVDSYQQPELEAERRYSWFDYRSRGFEREPRRGLRIDMILTSRSLSERLRECGIDYEIRSSEKPSDHCPVWADFSL